MSSRLSRSASRESLYSNSSCVSGVGDWQIGDRVRTGDKSGRVAFVGHTKFAPGEWIGVILDKPEGKNDGSVQGVFYFSCEKDHGLFCKSSKLERIAAASPGIGSPARDLPSKYASEFGFDVGERVIVSGGKIGILRFLGPTEFAQGIWAGVELDTPHGKNDGSVQGKRYFVCKPLFGLFAPATKTEKAPVATPSKIRVHHNKTSLLRQRTGSQESLCSASSSFSTALRRNLPSNATPTGSQADSYIRSLQGIVRQRDEQIEQLMDEREKERKEMAVLRLRCDSLEKERATSPGSSIDLEMRARMEKLEADRREMKFKVIEKEKELEDVAFRLEEEIINCGDKEKRIQELLKMKESPGETTDAEEAKTAQLELQKAKEELTELRQKVEHEARQNEELRQQLSISEAKNRESEEKLSSFNETKLLLETQISMLEEQAASYKKNIAELEVSALTAKTLEAALTTSAAQVESAKKQIEEMELSISGLEGLLSERNFVLEAAKDKLAAQLKCNADLQSQLKFMEKKLAEEQEARDAFESHHFKTNEEAVARLNEAILSKEEAISRMNSLHEELSRLKAAKARREEAESQDKALLHTLQSNLSQLESEMAREKEARRIAEVECQKSQELHGALLKSMDTCEGDEKERAAQLEHQLNQISLLSVGRDQLKKMVEAASSQRDKAQEECKEARDQAAVLEQKSDEATVAIHSLQNELEELREELERKKQSHASEVVSLKEKERGAEERLKSISEELSKVHEDMKLKEADLEKWKESTATTETRIRELESEIDSTLKRNAEISEERSILQCQVESDRQHLMELQRRIEGEVEEKTALQERINTLQNTLDVAKRDADQRVKEEGDLIKELRGRLREVEAESAITSQVSDGKIRELISKLEKGEAERTTEWAEQKEKVTWLSSQVKQLEEELARAQKELEETAGALDAAAEIRMVDSSSEKAKESEMKRKGELVLSVEQLHETADELNKKSRELEEMKTENAQLENAVTVAAIEKMKLESRVAELSQILCENDRNNQPAASTLSSSSQDEIAAFKYQIEFLNSIIADQRKKEEKLKEEVGILRSFGYPESSSELTSRPVKKELPKPRLFCDICDFFDLHDTEDCPTQSMQSQSPPPTRTKKRPPPREYCDSCEEFGHSTVNCPSPGASLPNP